MAALTKEQVLKLAALSRLQLTDKEVEQFQEDLSKILEYVEQLESIDVEGLTPAYQVGLMPGQNRARVDEVSQYQATADDLKKLPPQMDNDYIKVGRMIL